MTTYTQFTPTPQTPFQFQATLDAAPYNIVVTWNVSGKRWYVNCLDARGNYVFTLPLIGSPADYDISMAKGYFSSTLVYRVGTGMFEVSP